MILATSISKCSLYKYCCLPNTRKWSLSLHKKTVYNINIRGIYHFSQYYFQSSTSIIFREGKRVSHITSLWLVIKFPFHRYLSRPFQTRSVDVRRCEVGNKWNERERLSMRCYACIVWFISLHQPGGIDHIKKPLQGKRIKCKGKKTLGFFFFFLKKGRFGRKQKLTFATKRSSSM